jgi:hypothetical protein
MRVLFWTWWLAVAAVHRTHGDGRRDERGDVPGWVLITVMTAGLVSVLWAVAGDALSQMLTEALASVSG